MPQDKPRRRSPTCHPRGDRLLEPKGATGYVLGKDVEGERLAPVLVLEQVKMKDETSKLHQETGAAWDATAKLYEDAVADDIEFWHQAGYDYMYQRANYEFEGLPPMVAAGTRIAFDSFDNPAPQSLDMMHRGGPI